MLGPGAEPINLGAGLVKDGWAQGPGPESRLEEADLKPRGGANA